MSNFSRKKKILLNTVSVNLGCSCRKLKLSSIFSPKPISKQHNYQKHLNKNFSYSNSSASSAWGKTGTSHLDTSTSTLSPYSSSGSTADRYGRVAPKSVAVEKDSSDPYLDFKQSMLQMIVENEIYTQDELKNLLNCFLQLNSPDLHGVIIRAFTEIWNGFFYVPKPY